MKDFSEIILPVLQNSFIVGGKKHNYTSFRYAILSCYPSFIWEGEENLVLITQKHRCLLDRILTFSPIFHIDFSLGIAGKAGYICKCGKSM